MPLSSPTSLVLVDGQTFHGTSFGAPRAVAGEVVFNTGLTGYVETLTDPSYRGQILVLTYPLQGNYGVPEGPFESDRIQVQGLVVSHYSDAPSHHRAVRSLGDWLVQHDVPALQNIDTRSLTRHLRSAGTMPGRLGAEEGVGPDLPAQSVDMDQVVDLVTPGETIEHPGGAPRVLLIDTGSKRGILRALQARGASVVQVPFHAAWEERLGSVDAVVLSNGPGDPASLGGLVERVRGLLDQDLPIFGICLGHQILALSAGAQTYKLKYGHRSHNQPVVDVHTGRSFITSQNHGYAVSEDSLPDDWEVWFSNLNDDTNEGIRHRSRPFWSVQFHPEAAAGPRDTDFLFDDFLQTARESR